MGKTIKLKSILDVKRIFKLKVKTFEPEHKLSWGDAQGTRIYSINDNGNGKLQFSMSEKIGGPIFPLFSKYIPSFENAFEQFAADLKKEAEAIMKTK